MDCHVHTHAHTYTHTTHVVCVYVFVCMMCVGVSACACAYVCLCMHVCVCLMCVCLAFRVMLNGMTKVATPLLASSSSLGRPIGTPRVFFNSKYLFFCRDFIFLRCYLLPFFQYTHWCILSSYTWAQWIRSHCGFASCLQCKSQCLSQRNW